MKSIYMIGLAPFSWKLGCVKHVTGYSESVLGVYYTKKAVFAFGPLRVSYHRVQP